MLRSSARGPYWFMHGRDFLEQEIESAQVEVDIATGVVKPGIPTVCRIAFAERGTLNESDGVVRKHRDVNAAAAERRTTLAPGRSALQRRSDCEESTQGVGVVQRPDSSATLRGGLCRLSRGGVRTRGEIDDRGNAFVDGERYR